MKRVLPGQFYRCDGYAISGEEILPCKKPLTPNEIYHSHHEGNHELRYCISCQNARSWVYLSKPNQEAA